jgi:hypothetical protein
MRYYPFTLKKEQHGRGRTTYTIEMRIGRRDVIVSDAPTIEEVLRRHMDLMNYALETRNLQGQVAARDKE